MQRHYLILVFLPFIISPSLNKEMAKTVCEFPVEGNYMSSTVCVNGFINSFSIELGGLLSLQDKKGQDIGHGNWELGADHSVTGTYKILDNAKTYTFRAKLNTVAGSLDGNWRANKNMKDAGHFFMSRTN